MRFTAAGFENIPTPEEIRAEKRRQILEKAAFAFSEHGYNGVSISQIAAEVGLTKTGIYHYVKSKEDLLFYCHEMTMETTLGTLEPIQGRELSGLEAIYEVLYRYIYAFSYRPFRFLMLDGKHELSRERREEIYRLRDKFEYELRRLVVVGQGDGTFRSDADPKFSVMVILGAVNWVPQWFRPEGEWSVEHVAHSVARDILRTIVVNQEDVEKLTPPDEYRV